MPGEEAPTTLAGAGRLDPHNDARLGIVLAPLDAQQKRRAGMRESDEGVLVSDVSADSPAARRGLRPGDVILRVGRTPVTEPGEVARAVREAHQDSRKQVVLLVRRDGNERFVAVPFEQG